jgi:hypothetical protein
VEVKIVVRRSLVIEFLVLTICIVSQFQFIGFNSEA